jgi:hypothetical protein
MDTSKLTNFEDVELMWNGFTERFDRRTDSDQSPFVKGSPRPRPKRPRMLSKTTMAFSYPAAMAGGGPFENKSTVDAGKTDSSQA